jgi:hypothetical protein
VIGDLNAAPSALGNIAATGKRRTADTDNGEQAYSGILDGLLHVLADVTHPSWFGIWADRRPHIGRSGSQEDQEFCSTVVEISLADWSGIENIHQRGLS